MNSGKDMTFKEGTKSYAKLESAIKQRLSNHQVQSRIVTNFAQYLNTLSSHDVQVLQHGRKRENFNAFYACTRGSPTTTEECLNESIYFMC